MNAGVSPRIPGFGDVVAAAARIAPHIVRTPVMRSPAFDARVGREVYFKCENLQTGGAFKYRGAMNVLLQLDPVRTPLVITHSSGNHGTALALAARARGVRAIVVIPRDSARSKIAAIEAAGARVELCEPGMPAREQRVAEILASEPAEIVHPFDDERIIAGQGTAALELLRRNSAVAAAAIRALSDEELERAAPASLYANAPITCQFMLEDHAVRHSYHHLARIRAALKR
jgi:threonine dehydratase